MTSKQREGKKIPFLLSLFCGFFFYVCSLLLDFQPFESLETLVDHDQSNLLPLSSQYHDQLPRIDFQDFEDFGGAFSLDFDHAFSYPNREDTMVDEKPQTKCVTSFHHDNQHHAMNKMNMINPTSSTTDHDNKCSEFPRMTTMIESEVFAGTNCGKLRSYKRCSELELDDIQKCFDLPIKEAAKELHVGVTRLKRRCRELNITRWPHRKFKSLKYLISNVKAWLCENPIFSVYFECSIFGSRA